MRISLSQSPRYPPVYNDSVKEKDTGARKDSRNEKKETTVLRLTYDGDGNRIGKAVTSRTKTESAQYLWDINHGLPQVLTESDGKGTALYSYGLGRISMADPRKGQMYYQYDGLGSVRSLTDRKGITRGLYAYDAFGKPLLSASHVDNDFQYTGEQVDDETGLIYLRSRYYDPEIGRFISRDPFAGFDTAPQSLNRYTYVQNNPVRYADPSGRVAWYAAPAVVGAAVNEAYYVGQVTGTYLSTGQWTGSWCIAGGRAAGGAAGGEVGAYIMATTMNPWVAGAAASGTSYAVDRAIAQPVLSALGVPGAKDEFTWEGAGIALGAGVVTGTVSNMAIPYSPTNTVTEIYARNVISIAGGSITQSYMNYGISNPGAPIRLGSGSLSGGKLY